MLKPLRSEVSQHQDLQFSHFGVLNAGSQSKSSLAFSITVNVLLALIILIIGAAAKKTMDNRKRELTLVAPLTQKPPEPIKPRIIPPKIVPPKPEIPPPEPKIVLPEVKIPDPPKIEPIKVAAKPLPAVAPAPPKVVVSAAAPKPTTVNLGRSASVPNNDPHPSAVALGRADNPIAASNRPATASVNLGNTGLAGMPPGSGRGPASTAVSLGSGQPNGSLSGGGARAVQGVKLGGIDGGTGNRPGNGVGTRIAQVQLGGNTSPAPVLAAQVTHAPAHQGPQVVFKPRPVYTAEATALHLEGVVSVKIRVSAGGAVSVVGVMNGLGHGLDESAVRAVQGTRFRPAVDASGSPVDWEGVVNISFQMAG